MVRSVYERGICSVDNTPRASVTPPAQGAAGYQQDAGAPLGGPKLGYQRWDAGSAETPANLVPHLFPELFPARRPFIFVDVEPIEDVEIFQDRMTIACHRQDAK